MTDPRLLRAYRRLLGFYPPGPRRDELLDTLIQTAPPGRRRPPLREIVNLVRHGSRARLGRPGSRSIVVLALFVALAGGFLGAGATNRLGWHGVEPLPTGAEATQIRETVFPGLSVWGGGEAAGIVRQGDGEGIEYGYAVSWVDHTAATRDVATYTAGVRARLGAAGWTVTGVDPPLDQTDWVDPHPGNQVESFTVTRGDLGLRFNDHYWAGNPEYDGDGNATYYLWQEPPSWLATVTWIGFLPAAFLAWLLTGWASRSLEGNQWLSTFSAVGAWLAVLLVLPAVVLTLSADGRADETAAPTWQGLGFALTWPATPVAVLTALILLAAATRQHRSRLLRRQRQAAARLRPPALIGAALLLGLGGWAVVTRHLLPGSCTPSVPAGVVDPPEARLSYRARVYIDARATDDQRNLAQAATWRGMGGGQDFAGDPGAAGFRTPYCSRGRLDAETAEALPRYWNIDLASPGLFDGLAAEMMAMPAIVAVEHVTP